MPTKLEGVNPAVLSWARKRSGRSIENVASGLKKDPATIRAWESGQDAPTYAQLENLAYRLYKRPLALFFFPEPPDETDPHSAFRTLPDFEVDELSPTTRFRIREAQSFQISLRELTDDKNPAPRLIFRDIKARATLPTETTANQVREYLGVSLEKQIGIWRNLDEAQKGWRAALEEVGIFTFKEAFRQEDVSGFCLYDVEFPVIYLNNSAPTTRQIFTYFHELGHILLATSGVTKLNDKYISALRGEERNVEVFCNRFAADFLVPWPDLQRRAQGGDPTRDQVISSLATQFKVSREAVLRRFLDNGRVTRDFYELKARQWREEAKKIQRKDGGDYYKTHATYLGTGYLQLAFRRYYEGTITLEQLAQHLNVNPRSVPGLETQALSRAQNY